MARIVDLPVLYRCVRIMVWQAPVLLARQYASTDKYGTSLLGLVGCGYPVWHGVRKAYRASFRELLKLPLPAIVHIIINKKI